MGYGLIKLTGKEMELMDMGVLKFSAKMDAYERLKRKFIVRLLKLPYNITRFALL